MSKSNTLVSGIGSHKKVKKYYDDWSENYDKTLKKWNYKAPKKVISYLKKFDEIKPKKILDIACGTGLFAEEILKIYPKISIDGIDISKKILNHAKSKKIYNNLKCCNFDKNFFTQYKYDLISCIGAMTYSKDPGKLIMKQVNRLKKSGFFIFTHRVDLWKKQNFLQILYDLSKYWEIFFISRPNLYLPNNNDFKNNIKIKVIFLKKK